MILGQPNDEMKPFDFEAMLARCLGKLDLLDRALFRFETVVQTDLEELEQAISRSDAMKIASIAHRIKGASSNVSALRVHAQAAKLEELARTQKLENSRRFGQQLRAEVSLFFKSASSRRQPTYATSGHTGLDD